MDPTAQIINVLVQKNAVVVFVNCCYCDKEHRHRLPGKAMFGTVRSADCGRGEYRIKYMEIDNNEL
jgi:hypothetical protein